MESQSQMLSPIFDPDLAPIPLEKYSSAVSLEGSRNYRWVHDVRKELALSFKTVDIPIVANQYEKRLLMTIDAGKGPLEQLDVYNLAKLARERNEHLQRGITATAAEPPVQIVVKYPCIAMRYPGTPPMVRRFQIKFRDETQYTQVFNVLKRLGFPLKESAVASKPETQSQSRKLTQKPEVVPSSSPTLPSWPSGSQQNFSSELAVNGPYPPFTPSQLPNRSDSTSVVSARPSSVFSSEYDKARSSSAMGSYGGRPSSTDFKFQPPPPRSSTSVPSKNVTPLYDSQMKGQQEGVPEEESSSINKSADTEIRDFLIAGQAGSTSQSISDKRHEVVPKHNRPAHANSQISQYFDGTKIQRSATAQSVQNPNVRHADSLSLGRHTSLGYNVTRPMAVPNKDEWIPPRRELPFAKPEKKPKEPEKAEEPTMKAQEGVKPAILAQPTTDSPDNGTPASVVPGPKRGGKTAVQRKATMPILPEKTVALGQENTAAPANETTAPPALGPKRGGKHDAQRKETAPRLSQIPDPSNKEGIPQRNSRELSVIPEEEASPLAMKSAAIVRPSTAPGLQSKTATNRKRAAETKLKSPSVKVVRMVNGSTQTQTGSGRDHTAPILRTITPTVGPVSAETSTSAPPENFIGDLETLVARYGKKTKPVELWETSEWETASAEERHAITEDWICKQLEDPKFRELCTTMENVWQRVGFECC